MQHIISGEMKYNWLLDYEKALTKEKIPYERLR
jgi:hypothetical protein